MCDGNVCIRHTQSWKLYVSFWDETMHAMCRWGKFTFKGKQNILSIVQNVLVKSILCLLLILIAFLAQNNCFSV